MVETLWWAAKYVGVLAIVAVVLTSLIALILEANGETKDEVELDYRDNYRRYHKDDLRD